MWSAAGSLGARTKWHAGRPRNACAKRGDPHGHAADMCGPAAESAHALAECRASAPCSSSLLHKAVGDHFDHRMSHLFGLRSAHLVSRSPLSPFVQQARSCMPWHEECADAWKRSVPEHRNRTPGLGAGAARYCVVVRAYSRGQLLSGVRRGIPNGSVEPWMEMGWTSTIRSNGTSAVLATSRIAAEVPSNRKMTMPSEGTRSDPRGRTLGCARALSVRATRSRTSLTGAVALIDRIAAGQCVRRASRGQRQSASSVNAPRTRSWTGRSAVSS
jgi:hypothetical protein